MQIGERVFLPFSLYSLPFTQGWSEASHGPDHWEKSEAQRRNFCHSHTGKGNSSGDSYTDWVMPINTVPLVSGNF